MGCPRQKTPIMQVNGPPKVSLSVKIFTIDHPLRNTSYLYNMHLSASRKDINIVLHQVIYFGIHGYIPLPG